MQHQQEAVQPGVAKCQAHQGNDGATQQQRARRRICNERKAQGAREHGHHGRKGLLLKDAHVGLRVAEQRGAVEVARVHVLWLRAAGDHLQQCQTVNGNHALLATLMRNPVPCPRRDFSELSEVQEFLYRASVTSTVVQRASARSQRSVQAAGSGAPHLCPLGQRVVDVRLRKVGLALVDAGTHVGVLVKAVALADALDAVCQHVCELVVHTFLHSGEATSECLTQVMGAAVDKP